MAEGGAATAPWSARELPAHWRAVEFISDLHLSAAMPATWQAWVRHLQTTDADAVFILGDLFEVWVGDDARHQPFAQACVDVLAAARQRLYLGFLAGNRDFLLGHEMCAACGLTALQDPTLLQAWGQRILVSHGDALCLADTDYQAFRRTVRSPGWQQDFLSRPLEERLRIAAMIRTESRSRQAFDGQAGVDLDADAVRAWLEATQADGLLHGHTHRPGRHDVPGGGWRLVLSDWDLDDAAHPRADVLRWTPEGFERRLPAGQG